MLSEEWKPFEIRASEIRVKRIRINQGVFGQKPICFSDENYAFLTKISTREIQKHQITTISFLWQWINTSFVFNVLLCNIYWCFLESVEFRWDLIIEFYNVILLVYYTMTPFNIESKPITIGWGNFWRCILKIHLFYYFHAPFEIFIQLRYSIGVWLFQKYFR